MRKLGCTAHAEPGERRRIDPRAAWQRGITDKPRALVFDAARAAYFEHSPRASRADAIAALHESLERLRLQVGAAAAGDAMRAAGKREALLATLRAKAGAFFAFYFDSPRDLDLGFALFRRTPAPAVPSEFDARLQAQLAAALAPTEAVLLALGMPARHAQSETMALLVHTIGLLVLSQAGRIRMFRQETQRLFDRYLDSLAARAAA